MLRPTIEAELARRFEEAVDAEALRNEGLVNWVRLVVLLGVNAVGLVAFPSLVGTPWWETTQGLLCLAWLGASAALLASRRFWPRWIGFLVALLDSALFLGVLFDGWAAVEAAGMDPVWMAVVGASGAAMLMMMGALRMRASQTALSAASALSIYILSIWPFTTPMHFTSTLALVGLGGIVVWLTTLTRRVARAQWSRETLAHFLPAEVLQGAEEDPLRLLTEARSADVTVLFTDIRGFTSWSESRSPRQVMEMLNRVQGGLADEVSARGGQVDKFLGDGMLAFFEGPEHADRALDAARACLEHAEEGLRIGAGLQSGEVVLGCLGGQRLEFTLLGDTVNTASRLESATKQMGVPLLAGDGVAARATRPLRHVGALEIRGKAEPMQVHTLPE